MKTMNLYMDLYCERGGQPTLADPLCQVLSLKALF